jgi:hypothetical protein
MKNTSVKSHSSGYKFKICYYSPKFVICFVFFFVISVVLLLIVMFCVFFMCKCVLPPGVNQMCTATGCQPNVYCHRVSTKCVLPPGVNPIAVDKYININIKKIIFVAH